MESFESPRKLTELVLASDNNTMAQISIRKAVGRLPQFLDGAKHAVGEPSTEGDRESRRQHPHRREHDRLALLSRPRGRQLVVHRFTRQ